MTIDAKSLYNERLGRYQASMALLPTDRVPLGISTIVPAYLYDGLNYQDTCYRPSRVLESCRKFYADFPEIDMFGAPSKNYYAPFMDAVENNSYKYPGRDLAADVPFQYHERANMEADEYEAFIAAPTEFLLQTWLPRILDALADRQSPRYAFGLLKGAMAQARLRAEVGAIGAAMASELGLPPCSGSASHAPFDELSDKMRDLKGILRDMRKQPEMVKKACRVMVPFMVNKAMGGDPSRLFPSYMTTHKPMFLSPKEFDEFYWPSLKEMLRITWECGVRVRLVMEGDWTPHVHRLLEVPKGSLVCELDMQNDIVKIKEIVGGHHCIAGGLTDPDFILASPTEVDEKVHWLCETIGKGGGFMINGPCLIPGGSKVENIRAMCDAVMKYGWYDKSIKHQPLPPPEKTRDWTPLVFTPWETRKGELGGVTGDEEPIAKYWNAFEAQALSWIWSWL
jgi:Uroporphyrinogen-III decarboxylase